MPLTRCYHRPTLERFDKNALIGTIRGRVCDHAQILDALTLAIILSKLLHKFISNLRDLPPGLLGSDVTPA